MICESNIGSKCVSRVVGTVDFPGRSVPAVVTNGTPEGQAIISEFLEKALTRPQAKTGCVLPTNAFLESVKTTSLTINTQRQLGCNSCGRGLVILFLAAPLQK